MSFTEPTKAQISIRYYLQGRRFFSAMRAMEFASKLHTGLRKDGITPEFHHQISIALFVRTLPIDPALEENVMAAAFLHDTREDYNASLQDIASICDDAVAEAVSKLSKVEEGQKKSMPDYFGGLASDRIASLVKGADRINNVQTMSGVFSLEKQNSYIQETTEYVLPMLKEARRRFPEHEPAYENMKYILQNQITLIQKVIEATRVS